MPESAPDQNIVYMLDLTSGVALHMTAHRKSVLRSPKYVDPKYVEGSVIYC